MNYRKGLFRIWLVITILWGGYWGYATYESIKTISYSQKTQSIIQSKLDKNVSDGAPEPSSPLTNVEKAYLEFELSHYERQINGAKFERDDNIFNLLSVPSLLLISYFVFCWIRKGFK